MSFITYGSELMNDAYLNARAAEKSDAMAAIAVELNAIEVRRQNPDLWERLCLLRAFQGIFSGCYGLAVTEARLSMVPPDQHTPAHQLPIDPITNRADLQFLFRIARVAADEPVHPFPRFGPVEVQ